MDIESFAAGRRERLTAADDAIRPAVEEALSRRESGAGQWWAPIRDAAAQVWLEHHQAEAPGANYAAALNRFRAWVAESLDKTSDRTNVERITRWAATLAVNAGTIAGAAAARVTHKMWVSMEDADVREMHRAVDGQIVPMGSTFRVGGHRLPYPGAPVGPPDVWIECRCVAMPASREGEAMTANTFAMGPQDDDENAVRDHDQDGPLANPDGTPYTGALVVLVPADDDPVVAASSEPAHLTTIWFGELADIASDPEQIKAEVAEYAARLDGPVVVPVAERGTLGEDGADVVFLEPTDSLLALRQGLFDEHPALTAAHDAAEQFPEWIPHVTLGYPERPARAEYDATEVTFDRIALWLGGEHFDYPMGGTVSDTITADAAAEVAEVEPDEDELVVDEFDDDEEPITEIPIHGVLAPEGVETGDGRGFRPGALSTRTLPIPFRVEVVGSHGGNQTSEVVDAGRIDEAWLDEASGMWRFRGAIVLSMPGAAASLEGIVTGVRRGVSIDADAMADDVESYTEEYIAAAEKEGRYPTRWFKSARIAGLTHVPIPAFEEAYVALGHDFQEDLTDEDRDALAACGCVEAPEGSNENDPAYLAAIADDPSLAVPFAPGTKDGPGWITHPIPTSRIRRYWVKGKGAAKIAWGTPGDFNRCRTQLAKYVQNPDWLAGLCANMHKEALGFWPAEHRGKHRAALIAAGGVPAPILTLVASAAEERQPYPAEWFADPKFTGVTPLTIDKATGRVYGHLAQWKSCHIGVNGVCLRPPHSSSQYANFLTGVIDTDRGEVRVGTLTYGIGHADPNLRAAAATAHYDQTDAVWAYVTVGEDKYGIWYAGVLRRGIDEDTIDDIRAIGSLSGDWRRYPQFGLDLVAAVSVNTPGYSLAASAAMEWEGHVDNQLSALGLGFVNPAEEHSGESHDEFLERVAMRTAAIIESRQRVQALRVRSAALRLKDARARAERIVNG